MSAVNFCQIPGVKKIMVPSDGTEFSEGAVREAVGLAKRCGAALYAISVVQTNPEYESMAPGLVEKAGTKAKEILDAVAKKASAEGVNCTTIALHGEEPYELIVEEAQKNNVDLIMMGRRGRAGIRKLVMGSVTARVIGHAHCDVIVVPRAANLGMKSVLAATDGSRFGEAAVKAAAQMAKAASASMTVSSVLPTEDSEPLDMVRGDKMYEMITKKALEDAEKKVKKAKEIAQAEGVIAKGYVMSGNPYETILKLADDEKADLIVVGSHGKTGLDRLLMGSVTERLVVLAKCAVLVVRP